MPSTRALRAAIAEPWAITADGLELILAVAARETEISIEALEAYRAQHVPTAERLTKRGQVGIVDVRGPLFRRANLFTAISGATSYDVVRRDLQAALDDASMHSIVMTFDTPGGEVTAVDELADAIAAGVLQKPIVAYVGGMAASAGYWLASQAREVVIAKTAVLGSIGVRAVLRDTSKEDAAAGRMEFISSQSPGKRSDLATDEGRARIQRTIDALADVFIAAVAKGRRIKAAEVIEKFGGGDVLVGADAIAAGMADRIGSFEGVVADLNRTNGRQTIQPRRVSMTTSDPTAAAIAQADHDRAVAAANAEGVKAERNRFKAVSASEHFAGREKAANHMLLSTDMSAEAITGLLANLPKETAQAAAPAASVGARAKDAQAGLVTAAEAPPQAPSASWDRSVARVNSRIG